MKTKDEIVAYLKDKHIYGRVLNYYEKNKEYTWEPIFNFTNGVDNFCWDSTPEGFGFWSEQQTLFRRWFYS